jgi:putative GTP pyrophosphokinase
MARLTAAISKQIRDAVKAYEARRAEFEADAMNLQSRLLANADLKRLVHSLKSRTKDPSHVKDKLERKAHKAIAQGIAFSITADNIWDEIPDLAGVRLLHLHMRQMEQIHPLIVKVFADEGYVVAEDPEAKTWDPEYEAMFKGLKVKVERNESLYTSVHYVVKQNTTTRRLCELQVRTLVEEVWGEISHTINYPHETDSVACKEQLKALARLVCGCSRLVDSIVASYQDHQKNR